MAHIEVDGITFRYTFARNVSLNRVNPHRLTVVCACGRAFMSHGCGNGIVSRLETVIRQAFHEHKQRGDCALFPSKPVTPQPTPAKDYWSEFQSKQAQSIPEDFEFDF